VATRIVLDREAIAEFCRRNHIRKLELFGSVLREDFTERSDVDVLVEFQSGHVPGLAFFRMEDELSGILARKVDLHTIGWLSPLIRREALANSELQYVET